MFSVLSQALQESYREIFVRLADFTPALIGAVIIFLVGWLVAWVLERLIDPILRGVLDPVWETVKLEDLRKRSRIKLDVTALLSRFIFWIVLAVAFLAALEVLGLATVVDLFNQVLGYIPNGFFNILCFIKVNHVLQATCVIAHNSG